MLVLSGTKEEKLVTEIVATNIVDRAPTATLLLGPKNKMCQKFPNKNPFFPLHRELMIGQLHKLISIIHSLKVNEVGHISYCNICVSKALVSSR